jgi:hypothetical protein
MTSVWNEPVTDDGMPAPSGAFEAIEGCGKRVPFTIATVALIALAGWLTRTDAGVQLSARAIARFGFAPADTTSFNLLRAVMSAFVTNGPLGFWSAIALTAAFAGIVEWRFGSLWATIAFWGGHLITLALSWLILAPMHVVGEAAGSLLYLARDVGASAGYVGCLGFAIARLKPGLRYTLLAVGAVGLIGMFAIELASVATEAAEVSAALSHLLALLIGFGLGLLAARQRAAAVNRSR